MQVTLDLPEDLARTLEGERQRIVKIITRGLRPETAQVSELRREVVSFLAHGPQPSEIIAFHPSERVAARASELRHKNQEGKLTPAEEAEMDDLAEIDKLISLLKAEARIHTNAGQ
ncbi:MAG: hypothetical protein C5B50_19820 [Verrucomicrobia bacterium]|nr:MAG: hypothetical protein C5B50_19820 [Verrucomicrobiota bacterium]